MAASAARARKLLLRFDDVSAAPHFDRVAGGWGRMGATRCDLKKVDEPTFIAAAEAAHARASQVRKSRRARR